ncbi:sensor histidine kinase [Bifidobacterium sp. 64T4]|uniref:sensor histidine kinase n=1 Tax=Bifidobacterium pongonis TaxID=2834432 RepID=UPI001C5965D0|nr:sensor histidine kinase [Bifidobacterium pongonis]MBW3095224.1 sensor histidine kinase [Bifidobacterium pongonis]
MIPCAGFMCLLHDAFANAQYGNDALGTLWTVLGALVAILSGFILVARNEYPEPVFWLSCLLVVAFPFDSLIVLMALTSLLARRTDRRITLRAISVAAVITVWAQLRDARRKPDASFWHQLFAKPHTGGDSGVPVQILASEATITITAIVVGLLATLVAVLAGLFIRSRATARTAQEKASAAEEEAKALHTDLSNQQLADAIAAEAHDTLAHSLSLLALNASALQAESTKLQQSVSRLNGGDDDNAGGKNGEGDDVGGIIEQSESIRRKTQDIRKQAAGALDEAHSVIDMLRHPDQARIQLAYDDDASLTRDSLDALLADCRSAGMRINAWIDIQQLSRLDDRIGTIAYHAVQEGLTNARRHAPEAPVSLEVTAGPERGVLVHVSNPLPAGNNGGRGNGNTVVAVGNAVSAGQTGTAANGGKRSGAGLAGLLARVRKANGTCRYGFDERRVFHLVVQLPWVE